MSGGFVLPDAVCGQSHFLPSRHLSVAQRLSALMSVNEGNDLCAACHVGRGARYSPVTTNWGNGQLLCMPANWCRITSPTLQRQAQIRQAKGQPHLGPTRAQLALQSCHSYIFRTPPPLLSPTACPTLEPKQMLL